MQIENTVVLFLNDGINYTNNTMTGALLVGITPDNLNYIVRYYGGVFIIPISAIKFIVESQWLGSTSSTVNAGWTEFDFVSYSSAFITTPV
jgi:hypothetical protein